MARKSPKGVGPHGSDSHSDVVRHVNDSYQYYKDLLEEPYQDSVEYTKLYLAQKRDHRDREKEKWRANVFPPHPYLAVEAKAGMLMDVILSADPMIQPAAVGDEDQEAAKVAERIFDYTCRRNNFRKWLDRSLRARSYQGHTFHKTIWSEKKQQVYYRPTDYDWQEFSKALADAKMKAGLTDSPDPLQEPEEFEAFRQVIKEAGKGDIPEAPGGGYKQILTYRGPTWLSVPLYHVFFDPHIQDWEDQVCVIHEMVQPEEWVKDQVKKGIFIESQVVEASKAWDGSKLRNHMEDIADMLKVGAPGANSDPYYKHAALIWEVFQPSSPHKRLVIMNQTTVVNQDPTIMPYLHGQIPISPLSNIPMEGFGIGLSDLKHPETLFREMIALRNLRLDAVTLATLPIFKKLRNTGMPEAKFVLRPGATWNVSSMDAIDQAIKSVVNPDSFREMDSIKFEVDDCMGVYQSARGAPSQVGRVSATESERRHSQAMVRIKMDVVRIEEDLTRHVKQTLGLWFEHSEGEEMIQLGGPKGREVRVSRKNLLDAMDMDFQFRGATRVLNKDLQNQQMMQFLKDNGAALNPIELRGIMKRIWENMGLKGADQVITDLGTERATKLYELDFNIKVAQATQMMAQLSAPQQMAGAMPGGPPIPGAGDAPEEMDLEQARAVLGPEMQEMMSGGGGQAPPGGSQAAPPAGAPAPTGLPVPPPGQ